MKKGLTEIIFIVDESGSMGSAKNDTIGGFNEFVEQQKKLPGEAKFTFVKFDNKYEIVYDGVKLDFVKPLNEHTYHPSGSTALLDAVGKTIDTVGKRLAGLPESERPEKVMFIVLTDGEENMSKEYIKENQVSDMVKHQREKYNWEFVFMGADIDAWSGSRSLGILNYVDAEKFDMKRSIKSAGYYTANYRLDKANFAMSNFNAPEAEIDKAMEDYSKETQK